MTSPLNVILVGAGKWAHECWAPLLREHPAHYTVRAVVDPERDRAHSLAAAFGLPDTASHDDLAEALERHAELHAGIVLAGPEQHATCIAQLADAGLNVLTEKPLATSASQLTTITNAVDRAATKLAVIQNYRYQNRIQVARRILETGELGALHYVVVRLAVDYRQPSSWDVGDAHTIPDPLLVEAAIHQLDMIRYLSSQDIRAVTAVTTNPDGSSFAGDCIGGLLAELTDGAFALYEATLLAAGSENRWRNEHYRLECTHGSLTCDGPDVTITRSRHTQVIPAPDNDMFDGHRRIVKAFADWTRGGPPVETTLEDNTRTLAAMFAALDSTRSGAKTRVPPVP